MTAVRVNNEIKSSFKRKVRKQKTTQRFHTYANYILITNKKDVYERERMLQTITLAHGVPGWDSRLRSALPTVPPSGPLGLLAVTGAGKELQQQYP